MEPLEGTHDIGQEHESSSAEDGIETLSCEVELFCVALNERQIVESGFRGAFDRRLQRGEYTRRPEGSYAAWRV